MFGVTTALALLGLLSLAIPIVLHLVNPGKGKLVWVGNIKLLQEVSRKRVTEFRIEQWLLFLTRLMMFTLLTLILAGSYFKGSFNLSHSAKVFVSEGWLLEASEQEKRALAPFQTLPDNKLWHHLLLAHQNTASARAFEVYTTNQLSAFEAPVKPYIDRDVRWHIRPVDRQAITDSTAKSLHVYSSPNQLQLKAALDAIKRHRLPELNVQWKVKEGEADGLPDWIIYLSESSLPEIIKAQAARGSTVLVLDGEEPAKPWGDGFIVPFEFSSHVDFPNHLLDKLAIGMQENERYQIATLASSQIETRPSINESGELSETTEKTPLNDYLWLLLVILFMIERYVAERYLAERLEKTNE